MKGAMQVNIMEEIGHFAPILVGNVEGNTQFRTHKWRCSDYNKILLKRRVLKETQWI